MRRLGTEEWLWQDETVHEYAQASSPSVKELLVASEDVPAEVIAKITSVLFEHRREMMDLVPLAGAIAAPERSGETFLPIHAGVWAFSDRDKPSFVQPNAEAVALMISIAIVATSAYLQWATRRRKRVLDAYNAELIELGLRARSAPDFDTLDECNALLAAFVGRIVQSAEHGHINPAEFTLFNFTYDSVEDAIKDRLQQLERVSGQERRRRHRAGRPAFLQARRGGEAWRGALHSGFWSLPSLSRRRSPAASPRRGTGKRRRSPTPSPGFFCFTNSAARRSRII